MTTLILATSSYGRYRPWMGLPVATSVGKPKSWPWAPLTGVSGLMPYGIFGNPKFDGDPALARTAYRRRLHVRSASIMAKLDELTAMYPGVPLVLLCYELDAAACHRSWAAEWFADRHGLDVSELDPTLTEEQT